MEKDAQCCEKVFGETLGSIHGRRAALCQCRKQSTFPLRPALHYRSPSGQGRRDLSHTADKERHSAHHSPHDVDSSATVQRRSQYDTLPVMPFFIERTNGYVEIDLEMKRRTLRSCEKLLPKKGKRSHRGNATTTSCHGCRSSSYVQRLQ
jgi:hypothetical protein